MKRKSGFTLIELLVVIAIISILAAIVVPQVGTYIDKSRMTRAVSEIRNAETALTKMLTDADKSNFKQFFTRESQLAYDQMGTAQRVYVSTQILYTLLRQGKNAPRFGSYGGIVLQDGVLNKLGSTYLDMPQDPWGNLYQFYIGPWKNPPQIDPYASYNNQNTIAFRGYRQGLELSDGGFQPFVYDDAAKALADAQIPGNPVPDAVPGFPAPKDLQVYIFSPGLDNLVNQQYAYEGRDELLEEYWGGGDDINNWDNQQGWAPFYS